MILLRNLRPGQRGRILGIEGPPRAVRRLEEFGLRPGVEVQMVRPGLASIIRANGSWLCLRNSESLKIFVEPEASPDPSAHLLQSGAFSVPEGSAAPSSGDGSQTSSGQSFPANSMSS